MKRLFFASILFLTVCATGFSQVNYSKQFRNYGNNIPETVINTTTKTQKIIATLNMLSQIQTTKLSVNQYDWSIIKRLPDYSSILYLNQKQDTYGRDLIQPAITNEMTDRLIRRNMPK